MDERSKIQRQKQNETPPNAKQHKHTTKAVRTVTATLGQKLGHGASLGRRKQEFPRVGVVKVDFSVGRLGVFHKGGLFKIAAVCERESLW